MMRKLIGVGLIAVLFVVMLAGCGDQAEVDVVIIKVIEEDTAWGCIGTSKLTVVKTKDNQVDDICGYYGEPGDTIKGYWRRGHWDNAVNGFRTKR